MNKNQWVLDRPLILSSTIFAIFLLFIFYFFVIFTPSIFNLKIASIFKILIFFMDLLFVIFAYTLFKTFVLGALIKDLPNSIFHNSFTPFLKGVFSLYLFTLFYLVVFLTPFIFISFLIFPLLLYIGSSSIEVVSFYNIYKMFSSIPGQFLFFIGMIVIFFYWINKLHLWEYAFLYRKESSFSIRESLLYSLKKSRKEIFIKTIRHNLRYYGIFVIFILVILFLPFSSNLFVGLFCIVIVLYTYSLPFIWREHLNMIQTIEANK